MFSWAVLAGAALSYLSLFALNGSDQGLIPGAPTKSDQESNRADLDRAQLSAQVRTLNETVASLRSDLARIKSQKIEQAAANSSYNNPGVASNESSSGIPVRPVLTEQIGSGRNLAADSETTSNVTTASLPRLNPTPTETEQSAPPAAVTTINGPSAGETSIPPIASMPDNTAIAPAGNPPPATTPTRRPRGPNLATSPLRDGKVPPLPKMSGLPTATPPQQQSQFNIGGQQPAYANQVAQPTSSIQTASTATPAQPSTSRIASNVGTPSQSPTTSFGSTRVSANRTATPAAVSLSTATSVTGLRASWLLLTTTHREMFIGYSPRYVANPATGAYQLLAGPISTRADADRVCNELRTQSINCGVADYIGNPL
jgi:hypothetical protein